MSTIERLGGGAGDDGIAAAAGDVRDKPRPVDDLYALAYDELRRRAAAVRRGDPFASVSTRTLVNEAWLKLAGSATLRFEDQQHLIHIVTRAMRQVLVDSARHRRAAKREGVVVPIDESIPLPSSPAERILAIDDALTRLERLDRQQAEIVQSHFFGGFSFAEIGEQRGVSESTVRRQWSAARALLKVWLAGSE